MHEKQYINNTHSHKCYYHSMHSKCNFKSIILIRSGFLNIILILLICVINGLYTCIIKVSGRFISLPNKIKTFKIEDQNKNKYLNNNTTIIKK